MINHPEPNEPPNEPPNLEKDVQDTSKSVKVAIVLVIITSTVQLLSTGLFISNDYFASVN